MAEKKEKEETKGRLAAQEPFAELREWIGEVEAFWTAQLDSFKTHAERPRHRRRPR